MTRALPAALGDTRQPAGLRFASITRELIIAEILGQLFVSKRQLRIKQVESQRLHRAVAAVMLAVLQCMVCGSIARGFHPTG